MAGPSRRRRGRRLLSLALATAVGAPLAVTALPAQAAGNSLYFNGGTSDFINAGPNSAIFIDGTITFDPSCQSGTRPGIDDFVYPATDVYIVPAGSASDGSGLTDAGGQGPNTIVGTSSGAFIGELIAVVTPSGSLGAGEYDVVYDTCQDGIVGVEDEIFFDAISVTIPDGEPPPVSDSIKRLKDAAREEYAQWLKTHIGLQALFKLDDALAIASCILAPSPGCLFEVLTIIYDVDNVQAQASDYIETLTLNLVANRAKNYGAIWQDPPDPEFDQPTTVEPVEREVPPVSGNDVADAFGALLAPLAEEVALSEALLHAIERYQGAQADGDSEWALAQARSVRDLSDALAEQLSGTDELQTLRDAIADDLTAIEDRAEAASTFHTRVRTKGFTADERRLLLNRGFSAGDIDDLEARFVADGRILPPVPGSTLTQFDALLAARAETVAALQETAAGWQTVVTQLEERIDETLPVADAGGPYVAPSGAVSLDGTASASPAGTLTSYDWDLDGDGAFDDATGATPAVTVDGTRLVGLQVTDSSGNVAVDYANVVVTGGDRAPSIDSVTPGQAGTVVVGGDRTFTVTASDPDGDALSYAWTVGGQPVAGATGASFTWTPTADDEGEHVVTVTVTAGGRAAVHSWAVSVTQVDGDSDGWTVTTDCDDTRADVHPGGLERLGNERDDDCDARTPDAPPGGILAGRLWAWGSSAGVPLLASQGIWQSPQDVTHRVGGDVRQVESRSGGGYAVMADGTVRAWGTGYNGALGNGTQNTTQTPVVVQNVGGGGALGNVREVAADATWALALRDDGTVVSWGANALGQLGDGTEVDNRLFPVDVVTADGTPLGGAAQVEVGENTSFAVMQDGSVMVWGEDFCDGANGVDTDRVHAAVNPLFGDGVVQLGSGDHGGAVVLKADGSVWTCSGYAPLLGRGQKYGTANDAYTPKVVPGFGPGSGVIDVAYGSEHVAVLKEDGSVWAWGRNLNGSLSITGIPLGQIHWTPVQIPLPEGPQVVDIEIDYAATTHVTRADGSVLVFGASVNGGGGVPGTGYYIAGAPQLDLGGGRAIGLANSVWNGLAVVVPPTDETVEFPLPWIGVSVADAEIGEATGGAFVVSLTEAAPQDVEIGWSFDGESGTVTVPAGQTSVEVPVSVTDDAIDEDDAYLAFTLTSVSDGVDVERRTAIGTVVDDDAAPSVSIADVTVTEGHTSLTDVELELTLSAKSGKDVEVRWATADGTASAGFDYTAASGVAFFPAGSTTATVHVAVTGDTVVEPHESFAVTLSDGVNANVGDGSATVDVRDDEPVVVTVAAPTVDEGDSGVTPAVFTLSVSELPAGVTVTVPWSVKAGTAEIDADVLAGSGSATLGGEPVPVTVDVVGDTVVEDLKQERFGLAIGALSATDGRPVVLADVAAATIVDNDVTPAPEPEPEPEPSWPFDGFFEPVDNLPDVNLVTAGRTIPLKFSLGGDRGLDIFAEGYPASRRVPCSGSADSGEFVEIGTPGASGLTYEPTSGRYHINWQTERAWKGQCRELVVRLVDGQEKTALFRFR